MSSQNLERQRIYQVWPAKNKFYCGGRLVFGPDASSLLLTTCMIGGPAIAFSIRMAYLISHRHPFFHSLTLIGAILLTFMAFTFLFLTSSRDPGIIPRNKQVSEAEIPDVTTQSTEWVTSKLGSVKLPRTKDVMVNGFTVKSEVLRYLSAISSSSCLFTAQSAITVSKGLIITVLGLVSASPLRNYPFFVCFLSCSTLLCIYVFVFSWVSMLKVHGEFYVVLADDLILGVLGLYCFVSVWFVGGLTVFHFYLICTNQTTCEIFGTITTRRKTLTERGS